MLIGNSYQCGTATDALDAVIPDIPERSKLLRSRTIEFKKTDNMVPPNSVMWFDTYIWWRYDARAHLMEAP
jgi:hypothetical protein